MRSGALRAIAHTGASTRLPDFPDIPTFKELGYDMVATLWFAISGPPNLPRQITEKMNAEINRGMQIAGDRGPVAARRPHCRSDERPAARQVHRRRGRNLEAGDGTHRPDRNGEALRRLLPDPKGQHAALL